VYCFGRKDENISNGVTYTQCKTRSGRERKRTVRLLCQSLFYLARSIPHAAGKTALEALNLFDERGLPTLKIQGNPILAYSSLRSSAKQPASTIGFTRHWRKLNTHLRSVSSSQSVNQSINQSSSTEDLCSVCFSLKNRAVDNALRARPANSHYDAITGRRQPGGRQLLLQGTAADRESDHES